MTLRKVLNLLETANFHSGQLATLFKVAVSQNLSLQPTRFQDKVK